METTDFKITEENKEKQVINEREFFGWDHKYTESIPNSDFWLKHLPNRWIATKGLVLWIFAIGSVVPLFLPQRYVWDFLILFTVGILLFLIGIIVPPRVWNEMLFDEYKSGKEVKIYFMREEGNPYMDRIKELESEYFDLELLPIPSIRGFVITLILWIIFFGPIVTFAISVKFVQLSKIVYYLGVGVLVFEIVHNLISRKINFIENQKIQARKEEIKDEAKRLLSYSYQNGREFSTQAESGSDRVELNKLNFLEEIKRKFGEVSSAIVFLIIGKGPVTKKILDALEDSVPSKVIDFSVTSTQDAVNKITEITLSMGNLEEEALAYDEKFLEKIIETAVNSGINVEMSSKFNYDGNEAYLLAFVSRDVSNLENFNA